jgi:SAM-dependent methyltransferase
LPTKMRRVCRSPPGDRSGCSCRLGALADGRGPIILRHVTDVATAGTARHTKPSAAAYYRRLLDGRSPVLDIGCGKGDFLGVGWIGADFDLDSLRGLSRVVQVDATRRLPFRDGSFRGILAKDLVEHLVDPRALLVEAQRVARPGATLVLVTPRAVPRAVWADYTHVRGFTKDAVRSLLADSGWNVDRISRMGAVPLAGRLNFVAALPALLAIPGLGHYFGTNWQVLAHRA